jgi:exoribonuclease R
MKLVGILELASKYRYGITSHGSPLYLFKPYDSTAPDYIVGSASRETVNQIAVIDACDSDKTTERQRANLSRIIGPVGNYDAEREALLLHYCPNKPVETPTGTPHDTAIPRILNELADSHRTELSAATGWVTFHIDPAGCRDIDDAIAYNHETRTWAITIADAAAAVAAGSPTDLAANAIGATFYDLEGRALRTMLPATISEDSASLLPGQRRRGVTLFLEPGQPRFGLTWITVEHSFTYDSFRGSGVAFDLQISKDPHAWIEELMIRYNREAAAVLKRETGFLRVQREATTDLPASLRFLAMEAATYEIVDNKPQNHATLGGLYCHASSPLRRYADLANQRVLRAVIIGHPSIIALPLGILGGDFEGRLNDRAAANRRWNRDLTFLTHVTPGRVHEVDVIWYSADRVWVPLWRRLIRLRHEEERPVGAEGRIKIYCDPTRRNWKERILTAPFLLSP